MLTAAIVFAFLASRALASSNFQFQLSQVTQCEPVTLTFTGNPNATDIPTWLTLLPFNSTPTAIPVPTDITNTGVYVTFLPLAAGTTFLAVLQDSFGNNVAPVSGILTVLSSPTQNSTCLPAVSITTSNPFSIDPTFSQCTNFTVEYNETLVLTAPSVQVFTPNGPSVYLNKTSDDSGVATYLMPFPQTRQVVLLLGSGGNQQTSPLMTVEGSSASSADCLIPSILDALAGTMPNSRSPPGVSKSVVIACAVAGSIVGVVAICMVIFILQGRRRKQSVVLNFEPVMLEKGRLSEPPVPSPRRPTSSFGPQNFPADDVVKDPPYTSGSFVSPTASSFNTRASLASWARAAFDKRRESHRTEPHQSSVNDNSSDRLSLNSLDIEGMLNMASLPSNRNSREPGPVLQRSPLSSPASLATPTAVVDPQFVAQRLYPARGHLRNPSDVPTGPVSVLSSASNDPFFSIVTQGALRVARPYSPLNIPVRPSRGPSAMGLPSNPRRDAGRF